MARPRSRSRQYNRENNVVNFEKARKQRAKRREEEAARKQKVRRHEGSDRRHRQKLRKLIVYGSIVLILVILIFLASFNFIQLLKEKSDLEKDNKRLQTELKEKEEELANANDPEYIEKLVREKLHMVRPGEILYIKREDTDAAD